MDQQTEPGAELQTPNIDALPTNRQVRVTVDTLPQDVPRGTWIVREFKTAVGVKAGRVLDQVISGEFHPLDDTASVSIEGGEVFVSHVPQGGSS